MTVAVAWTPLEKAIHTWIVNASGFVANSVIWSGKGAHRPDSPWISLLITRPVKDGIGWVDTDANPLVFADTAYTADPVTDILTAVAHGRLTGDGPVEIETTGTPPGGLSVGLDYWVIKLGANTFQLAETFEDAMALIPVPIAIGPGAGTGVQTLVATDDTVRAGEEVLMVVRANYEATLSVQCYGGSHVGDTKPMAVLQNVAMRALLPSVRAALEAVDVGVTSVGPINDVGDVISKTTWEPRAHMDVKLWIAAEVSETGTVIDNVDVTFEVADRTNLTFLIP